MTDATGATGIPQHKKKTWPAVLTGITGGIAAGKSVVASMFGKHGFTVFSADQWAREAVKPGSPALGKLVEKYGNGILENGMGLNRRRLLGIMLESGKEKKNIERIIHPHVFELMDISLEKSARDGARYAAVEIPLLHETGTECLWDVIVTVTAPDRIRLERIIKRNMVSPQTARKWLSLQMPQETKTEKAHYVINNNSTLEELKKAASRLAIRIRQEHERKST